MSTPNNTQLGNKSVQEKRRNSGHCPALQRGAMTETLTRITITPIRHVDVCRSGHAAI